MPFSHVLLGAEGAPAKITIRRIGFADLKDALAKGADDFLSMPTHAIFLCAIYPVIALLLVRLAFGYSILPLVYPLVSGFGWGAAQSPLSVRLPARCPARHEITVGWRRCGPMM